MSEALFGLWEEVRPAFSEAGPWERARTLGMSLLTCLGRHTVTGLLTTSGQQEVDWSAAYRLFGETHFDLEALWRPVRRGALELLRRRGGPVVAALDDTLLPRWGRKVVGASWRRDPLGPRFQTNLVWAQRFLQTTLLVPEGPGASPARAVPVDLVHAPTPRRPRRGAPAEEHTQYRQAQREQCLSVVAVTRLEALREALDIELGRKRELLVAVDGGYTNRTVFRKAPAGVVLIGRVRKDASLYAPPEPASGRGRPRCYGRPLPTPEQIRQEEATPWRRVRVYAAGRRHHVKVKVVGPVRWKAAGAKDLLLVVVQPLRYRPSQGHRLLYRDPAYLLCGDPTLPLAQILQAYIWRWEVEVSFREEKSLLGMGEAQVRTESAVAKLPAFVAATYGMLHVAAGRVPQLPRLARPCWQRSQPQARVTTAQLQAILRTELWGRALGVVFEDFVSAPTASAKPLKITSPLAAAVLYAQR